MINNFYLCSVKKMFLARNKHLLFIGISALHSTTLGFLLQAASFNATGAALSVGGVQGEINVFLRVQTDVV